MVALPIDERASGKASAEPSPTTRGGRPEGGVPYGIGYLSLAKSVRFRKLDVGIFPT